MTALGLAPGDAHERRWDRGRTQAAQDDAHPKLLAFLASQ